MIMRQRPAALENACGYADVYLMCCCEQAMRMPVYQPFVSHLLGQPGLPYSAFVQNMQKASVLKDVHR